ncbi:MAG: SDR family NAD(P)-dependent oxidoreductase [Shimia sp.]
MADTLPILITGASRGLGAALAPLLATRAHIIAVARTVGGLEELDDAVKAAGGTATLAPLDVTDDGAMQHLCASIHQRFGGLSMWLHTAIHAAPLAPAPMVQPKDWSKSVTLNVDATARLIRYIAPLLPPNGKAVFFADPVEGAANFGAYGATKAAQMALVRSWQAETPRTGPHVQIVTPPPMPTATRARFHPGEDRSMLTPIAEAAAQIAAQL